MITIIIFPLVEGGRVGSTVAENDNPGSIYNQLGQIGLPLFILSLGGMICLAFNFTKNIEDESDRRLLIMSYIIMFIATIFA